MASIQFYGKQAVLQAYTARGLDTWALFDGKNLMNAGDGEDSLSKFLDMLSPAGDSPAIYILKAYRNVEPDDITDKTECNGAFRFKLTGTQGSISGAGATRYAGGDPIMAKLHGIVQEKVGEVIERMMSGEPEEKEESFTDVLMGLLRDPEKLAGVIGMVKTVFSGTPSAIGMPVSLAGINSPTVKPGSSMSEEETIQRLSAVLDRLEKVDPTILIHLEKLAELAETKPALFKMMLAQLDAI